MSTPHQQLEERGYILVNNAAARAVLDNLETKLECQSAGKRNLLSVPAVRESASSKWVHDLIDPVWGPKAFAVRSILFNKRPSTNWKVAWHQDCMVAVRQKTIVSGWGPWSVKEGVHHVRPPAEVLTRMVALRIHLDDCGVLNGPLRVLPGSHRHKFLSDEQISCWPKENAATCIAARGDAILMRPLLLHASSAATVPTNRRVVHIEFAVEDLPDGIEWYQRI